MSLARAAGFNCTRVADFYDKLEATVQENKFTPNRIHNCDGTGFSCVQRPLRILARKDKHQVCERGKNITFVCCVSATGHDILLLVIFPREGMKEELQEGAVPGSIFACQKNDWSNLEPFTEWLKHFVDTVKPSVDEKVLFLLDGHVSHTQNILALQKPQNVV